MKIVRKLGQSRELVGVDREVERPVHDVNVAPLGVQGNAQVYSPLESRLHVLQRIVTPTTEVVAKRPVRGNIKPKDISSPLSLIEKHLPKAAEACFVTSSGEGPSRTIKSKSPPAETL